MWWNYSDLNWETGFMWIVMPLAYAHTYSYFPQKLTCGTLHAYIYRVIHRKRPIRLGSLRDTQKYFWNVERLLRGQNEKEAFGEDWCRCLLCNAWNKIDTKRSEVAFLGILRMIPRSFYNFPRRDSLKTLELDHLTVETPTDLETDYSKSWYLLFQVSNSSARCEAFAM